MKRCLLVNYYGVADVNLLIDKLNHVRISSTRSAVCAFIRSTRYLFLRCICYSLR